MADKNPNPAPPPSEGQFNNKDKVLVHDLKPQGSLTAPHPFQVTYKGYKGLAASDPKRYKLIGLAKQPKAGTTATAIKPKPTTVEPDIKDGLAAHNPPTTPSAPPSNVADEPVGKTSEEPTGDAKSNTKKENRK